MSKKEWGNATWYLFHTLAKKLKPESSNDILELYNQIYHICANLPCPDCSNHAISTLKTLNSKNIKTIEDLVIVMWQFHNKVNVTLNKQTMTIDDCNELYKKANLRNIINNFLQVMKKRMGSERAMLYSHHRNKCINNFTNYINKHYHKYNWQ